MAEAEPSQSTGSDTGTNPAEEKKNNLIKYAKIAYEKLYGTAKPFPSMSKRSIHTFFVEGGIHYLAQEGDSMQKPDVLESLKSYNEILNRTTSKRKIVEGEPGYGKSTYALQYLHDWCTENPKSPLKDVVILIYLQLRQLAGVKSIYTAIKKFIVPKDGDMDEACIKEILKVYKKSVVILFDSYDEYPEKNDTETDISSIIEMKMFQEMVVMIFTRTLNNLLPDLHPNTKRFRLTGFGVAERRKYILKVMDNDVQLANQIEKHLQGNPLLEDLCQVPIFFTMVAHIVHKSPEIEIFSSLTKFFKYVIKCFHNHMKSKNGNNTEAPAFEGELAKLYRIAFDGLTQKKQQLSWKKTYLVKELGQQFYDYYIDLGILAQDEVFCIVQYQYEIEARLFHKIICEFYASHHLVLILSEGTSSAASSIKLEETLNSINPFDLQYVYRFACGLNKSAADIIIKHLSETKEGRLFAILCMLEQEEKSEQCLKSVKDLVSSTIAVASHHAKLLQRSTIQVLEVASANQISISAVTLFECSPRVDESGLNLIFQSGLSLAILSSLQDLVIQDTDRRLTNKELAAILLYSSQCTSLKMLVFYSYYLPKAIPVGSIPSSLKSRNVKVFNYLPYSSESCRYTSSFSCLDLQTGGWQAPDFSGRLLREEGHKPTSSSEKDTNEEGHKPTSSSEEDTDEEGHKPTSSSEEDTDEELQDLIESLSSGSPVPSQSADVPHPKNGGLRQSEAAVMLQDCRNLLQSLLSDIPVPSQSTDARYPKKRRFDDYKAAAMAPGPSSFTQPSTTKRQKAARAGRSTTGIPALDRVVTTANIEAPGPSSVTQPSTTNRQKAARAGRSTTGIPALDRVVTTANIEGLSEKLCHEWKTVGRKLGIEEPKLEAIDTDYKMVKEKVYQMLLTWKRSKGKEATCGLLGEALQSAGRKDLQEYVYQQGCSTESENA